MSTERALQRANSWANGCERSENTSTKHRSQNEPATYSKQWYNSYALKLQRAKWYRGRIITLCTLALRREKTLFARSAPLRNDLLKKYIHKHAYTFYLELLWDGMPLLLLLACLINKKYGSPFYICSRTIYLPRSRSFRFNIPKPI